MAKSYWEKRAEASLFRAEQKAFHSEVNLLRRFQQAQREVKTSIEDILKGKDGKFLPLDSDASSYLDLLTPSEVKMMFPGQTKVKRNGKTYLLDEGELRTITRKEALQARIDNSVMRLREYEQKSLDKTLSSIYEEEYYRKIYDTQVETGRYFDFAKLDENAIRRAVDQKWVQGENFSDRIWRDKALLVKTLDKNVVQGVIKGEDFGTMVRQVEHDMQVDFHAAQRLVRTETNRIYNLAANDSYAEGGIEQYQILATLDNKTSKICQEQDGKIYDVKDMVPGVNAPPFHPNCRTTTIPVVVWNKIENRAARDTTTGKSIEVPGNMTYEQWQQQYGIKSVTNPGLSPEEWSKEWEAKFAKNGISSDTHIALKDYAKDRLYKEEDEQLIIEKWSGDSYVNIQRTAVGKDLRKYDIPEELIYRYQDYDEQLHDILQNSKTPTTAFVQRGIRTSVASQTLKISKEDLGMVSKGYHNLVGKVLKEPAYQATTINPEIGGAFSRDVVYKIEVPKGAKGLFLEEFATYGTEEELLLDKGSRFQVMRVVDKTTDLGKLKQVIVYLKMLV